MFPASNRPAARWHYSGSRVCMSFAGRLIAAARRREGRWRSGGRILPWKSHGTTQQRLGTNRGGFEFDHPSLCRARRSTTTLVSVGRSSERASAYINHPPFTINGSPSSISLLTTRRVEHLALHLIPIMAKACVPLLCVLLVVSSAFVAAEAGRQWDQGREYDR
jgi:hypothetical protein